MKKLISMCAGAALCILASCSEGPTKQMPYNQGINVIPTPVSLTQNEGVFKVGKNMAFQASTPEAKVIAEYFASKINQATGYKTTVGDQAVSNGISLVLDDALDVNNEGYTLDVTTNGVTVKAKTPQGLFYGMQTFMQLLPAEIESPAVVNGIAWTTPCVTVKDEPRFAYRGFMLDPCRHFIPVENVKKQIDVLSLFKVNTMHWHLTDDQGWRVEIKKYPKLTEIGAKRIEGEGTEYGGFYTQEEIKDVVKYAADRFITVIPELELPGHEMAAIAAYPELSCKGEQGTPRIIWGVEDIVMCAGKEEPFKFLEDVIDEIAPMFPSEYFHIGGDECPKVRWEKCPKCQARIKAEGIKGDKKHSAEEYLQSYVISRMEKFVESKGRHIIGWDEILEGGLAPNATVMSWRGMDGGIEAAKQKHNVVMTPNTYVYLDYYQSADTDLEPDAIGGYLPLEKVYSFEPTAGISPEDQKYVIGAQANLWTEYIPTFSQVEYMIMPRIDAVADIQWSDPSKKDYQTFLPRVARMTQLYDRLGYNYGKHIFDINASLTTNTENGTLDIALTKLGEGDIYYTVDGSDPTIASIKYEGPVQINQDCEFKAIVVRPNGTSRVFSEEIFFNKATMKPITLKEQPSRGYVFNGAQVLVDGLRGGSNYKTGHWLGFQGKDLDATIDLKEPTEIQKVSFNTNVVKGDWIMGASAVTVKVSDDGKNFKEVASKKIPELTQNDKDGLYPQEISFAPVKARYVEVIINSGKLPKWHGGAGSPAFLFVDEIEIL